MELAIFIMALAGFGILAYHTGHDSRASLISSEHDLARHGMVWPRPTPDEELATELHMARTRGKLPSRTPAAGTRRQTLVIPTVHASIDPCR